MPVSNSMKPKSVDAKVDNSNITTTSLIIICNYIRDAFGKRAILHDEEVQNLGTGYIESE